VASPVLNRLEHYLLSKIVDDIEPLFILYKDATRDIRGITADLVLAALIKLVNSGYVECILKEGSIWKSRVVTLSDLKNRLRLPVKDSLAYQLSQDEYYFKITTNGKAEEAEVIYYSYYQ
jgi:hypothetical protein